MRAIIFDLDETLYNYSTPDRYSLYKVGIECVKNHITRTPDEFISHYYNVVSELFAKTDKPYIYDRFIRMKNVLERLGHYKEKIARSLADLYWKTFYSQMRIWPDLHPVMEFLKSRGLKIGILTDGLIKWQWKKIKILRIENFIDAFVTAEELGFSKPKKKAFLTVLEKLEVAPNQTIMVGDNLEKDVLGAIRVGINAIYFDRKQDMRPNTNIPRILSLCGLYTKIPTKK